VAAPDTETGGTPTGDAGQRPSRIQAENRETILDAAQALFSTYGFRGTTLDQIARRAGMSKPNLLYYFKSKDALYVAALEAILDYWLEPLRALDPRGDPIAEIARYIKVKVAMARDRPAASRLFATEVIQGAPHVGGFLKGALKALVDEKAAVIARWVDEARLAPVDPHHLIVMIWAVTQHYADFDVQVRAVLGAPPQADGGVAHFDDAGRTILGIFLEGLKPR